MAIDPRISLTPAPTINVGERFGQALRNLQGYDNLQQNRQLAPLKQQAAQMQMEVAQQQHAQASNPLNQAIATAEQVHQFDFLNAQDLSVALNTGDPQIVNDKLVQQKAVVQQLVDQGKLPQTELQEFDAAIAMVSQPNGMQRLSQATNSFLQSADGGPSNRAARDSIF